MDSRWLILSLTVLTLVISAVCQETITNCSLFDVRPEDTVIEEGGTACLECRYFTRSPQFRVDLGDGLFSVIQVEGGQDAAPEECDCFNPGNGSLCFENVDITVQRRYSCTIQEPTSINLVRCFFNITLATLPMITSTNRMYTVDESATQQFVLTFEGDNPPATAQWFRNGAPLTLGDRFNVDTGSLTITDIQPEDRGEYEVRVSNIAGTVSATYQLFVNFVMVELTEDRNNAPPNGARLVCTGTGYPLDLTLSVDGDSSGLSTTDNTFESVASIAVDVTVDCQSQSQYLCVGTADRKTAQEGIVPAVCTPSTPEIASVVTINSSAVTINWTADNAESFTIRYMIAGSNDQYMSVNVPGNVRQTDISGLSPGQMYSFEVGAGTSPVVYSAAVTGTTNPCETNIVLSSPIVGVSASTMSRSSRRTITLTWAASQEEGVYGYRVYVVPCTMGLPCTPIVIGSENTEYEFPPEICDGIAYSFFIQSINNCLGGGPNSSLVVRTCDDSDRLTELKPDVEAVTIKWTFVNMLESLRVSAIRVVPNSQNQLVTSNYDVTPGSFALESVCIRELESDTTYEVCLHPKFTNIPNSNDAHCLYVTTLQGQQQQQIIEDCLMPSLVTTPTTNVPVNPGSVIQNWHIAVIVVGGLAIVAMVFCLVGLCFACQNSKQKVDFGSNSSLDTATYNQTSSIRDGMSMQRSMSPSRSCLSYHHKGHSTNWSDHVDTLRQMETDGGTHV